MLVCIAHTFDVRCLCKFFLQYRDTLSDGSKIVVGVLLFAANVVMLVGPFIVIGLVAFQAMPTDYAQWFVGNDAPQTATDKVAEVFLILHVFCQVFQKFWCVVNSGD